MHNLTIILLLLHLSLCYKIQTIDGLTIYPRQNTKQYTSVLSYCQKQSQIFQFPKSQIMIITSQNFFTVTVFSESSQAKVTGFSSSVINNAGKYEGHVDLQIQCTTYQSTAVRLVMIFKLKKWSKGNSQYLDFNEETNIQIPTIIYCIGRSQITTIENFIKWICLGIWILVHLLFDFSASTNLPIWTKIALALNQLGLCLQINYIFIVPIQNIFTTIFLIFYGFRMSPTRRIIWAILIILRLIDITSYLYHSDTVFFYSLRIICVIEVSVLIITQINISRLRNVFLMILAIYCIGIVKEYEFMKERLELLTLSLQTPYNCTNTDMFLAIFMIPIITYMKKVQHQHYLISMVLLIVSLVEMEFLSKYLAVCCLLLIWFLIQLCRKGPFYVIPYRTIFYIVNVKITLYNRLSPQQNLYLM